MTARPLTALGVLVLCLAFAAPASAQDGVQHLHFAYGPVEVAPGQNTIALDVNTQRPTVDGWIVGFRPNLVRVSDGSIPRVDVIHLHHGVWLKNFQPLFAAGEEKTAIAAPPGYGWRYRTSDKWHMNHMIHNLTPTPDEVFVTYDIDFIPDGSPAAQGINEVQTIWLDTVGGAYPVFDAKRGAGGNDRRFTYPDESRRAARNGWTAPEDGALVGTAGHLHPGGLWTDLTLTRDGKSTRLFRSKAKYYEPAGAVSWDVSMTVTPPQWRVQLRKGDVLSVSGTYDTKRASWYESMAIMPTIFDPGGTGVDPFTTDVDVEGQVTHGHLAENNGHGGGRLSGLANPLELLSRPVPGGGAVAIKGFVYGRGDLSSTGKRGRPARVRAGRGLKFVNRDAKRTIFHTITACKAPCNRTTGIAYPLANGDVDFDSGELGFGPRGFTAAANRDTWTTPKRLKAGKYTYFCRVHPFMRGAFEVTPKR